MPGRRCRCRDDDAESVVKLFHIRGRRLKRRIAKGDDELAARVLQNFHNEANLTASLNHPNIINVIECATLPNATPYFVMPYLPDTLATRIWPLHLRPFLKTPYLDRRIEPICAAETVAILQGLLSALDAVHKVGVVHRDIKPNNILISNGGRPVLCDFGCARMASGESITWRSRFGVLPFVSPEQRSAPSSVDFRADVYSIGVIAYLMLAGQAPQPLGESSSLIADWVDKELANWVMTLIDPDPNNRPTDARENLIALQAAVGTHVLLT